MIRNIRLNIDQESTKYPGDDIPSKVLTWLENNKREVEAERADLIEGQIIVILQGKHTSMRGVFIKRLPKNLILVSGLSSTGVSFTVMNQRYVLPVSVFVPLERSFIDSIEVQENEVAKIRDWTTENAADLEILDLITLEGKQETIDTAINNECAKTKGLKTYFVTPFTLPVGVDAMGAFY
ncbi:large subunit ribosomal protein L6e [Nematocida displodere]|uniref:Large subunit ribosomal protein L6e n=1 Tax=Nematocida displodere TaxID=1805483 RepID=A0A177EC74_9MICR|nr:large subunit ribosomal protein L6e [Nematocida displodere]